MPKLIAAAVFSAVLLPTLLISQLNGQPTTEVPAAPVPAQILTARKVFLSNAGVDGVALDAFRRLGENYQPYNQFYAAMKNWGHYELVNAPADADLVFEIHFGAPMSETGKLTSFAPQYVVTILDAKTHFKLWTLAEPVEGAFRKKTFIRNLDQTMNRVIDDLKKLTGEPLARTSETQKQL